MIAITDELGMQLVSILSQIGIKIPEDISVMGIDGLEMGVLLPKVL